MEKDDDRIMESAIQKNIEAGFMKVVGTTKDGDTIVEITDLGREALASGRLDN